MHFVDRDSVSAPTELLQQLQEKHGPKWHGYHQQKQENLKPKQPSDSEWRNTEVLAPLALLFQHNCGYCGIALMCPTTDDGISYHGQVDHYHPKSEAPDLVYAWPNYIWSCPACNRRKSDYYQPTCLIFNPCCKADMDCLGYNEGTGAYYLHPQEEGGRVVQARFAATIRHTYFNTDDYNKKRRTRWQTIKSLLDALHTTYLHSMLSSDKQQDYERKFKVLQDELEMPSNFRLMLKQQFEIYRKNHPDFPLSNSELGLC